MERIPVHMSVLQEVAAKAADAGLSRRAFLGLLGAAGGAAALSGCGKKAHDVRWANMTLYLDQDDDGGFPTLEQFQDETGISVSYLEDIEDYDGFHGKVRARLEAGQDIGYDLVVLVDWMTARWVRGNLTNTWSRAAMPNTKNLRPQLENVDYDPGRTHSIAWQSGFAGLAWNKKKVPDGLHSIDDLWKPEFAGRTIIVSEMRDVLGLVMRSQGVDPGASTWGADEFANALDVVTAHMSGGHIRKVTGAFTPELISEDALVAIAWSGDIQQINYENGDRWAFAVPDSGGMLWNDNLVMPATSDKVTDVQKLVDFYYDPQVAATVAAYVNYITPVVGAQEAMATIAPELVDDELIFPTDETLSNVSVFRTLTPEEDADYNGQFLTVIGS